MNHKLSLLILILIGVLCVANFTLAWEVGWPEIPGTEFVVGDKCPIGGCPPDGLPEFIAYLFTFALVAAGMVALLMLVLGAVQYVASAAMPGARVAARSRMTSAVLGLLLLFGSYVLLNTINPELVMPGLGLGGAMPTDNLSMPSPSTPMRIGVILYATDDCSDGGRRYLYSHETLDLGGDDNWDNRAVAFKIFKIDDKIQFFRENKFAGEASFELTGPRDCTKFADYEEGEDIANSDFTLDVSSIKFIYDKLGVTLCTTEQPDEDNCKFFDAYPGAQPQRMENVRQGSIDKPPFALPELGAALTFFTPNYYDLCNWSGGLAGSCAAPNPYSPINDNEIQWIDVPCGMYAMLCIDPWKYDRIFVVNDPSPKFPHFCFFILESSMLKYYGDFGNGTSDHLDKTASFLMILGYKDNYFSKNPNSDICKGVTFYTGDHFNRDYFEHTFGGFTGPEEAAGFPIGWGDLSVSDATAAPPILQGDINLTTDEHNFTMVKNIGKFEDLDWNDGVFVGGDEYDISSLKLLGNGCKLRICNGVDPVAPAAGDICETLYHSYNELPCQNAAILSGSCVGPSAACENPPGTPLGCNCSPDAVAGDPCACCDDADIDGHDDWWGDVPGGTDDAVIKSFILCNENDNTTPQCANW